MNGKIIAIVGCVVVAILCFASYMVGHGNRPDSKALEEANKVLSSTMEHMKKEHLEEIEKLRKEHDSEKQKLEDEIKGLKGELSEKGKMIVSRNLMLWGGSFLILVVIVLSTVIGCGYRKASRNVLVGVEDGRVDGHEE